MSSARESLALADDEEERPLAEEEPDKAAPVTANGPVSADDTSMLTSQDPLLGDAPKPEEQEPVGGEQDLVEEELVELVEEEEEEEGQDDKDPAVFLREGLMCQRQIINVQNGRLVGGHTENSCYGFYAPPQVLARMKVDQFKDFKYKYEGQRRDPWACVACGHEQQRHQ